MCIFLRLGSFSLHELEDTALLRGIWVGSFTRGDTASSDEVVIVNVHNLFLDILGVPASRAKGYRFEARPVCRFLFGGTTS